MALSDEDFNIEDEEDYETEDSETANNKFKIDESDDSNESTQSEIDSEDETTESESDASNLSSDSDSDSNSSDSQQPQLTEEQLAKLAKQKQMAKAEQDLKNIHKTLRKIIEDKLASKKKKKYKKYRDKSREQDDEYLEQCEADMNDCNNGGNSGIIDVLSEQPSLINLETGVMRNYQLDGLNWLIRVQETGLNAILADEMGLGKTLQCISLLAYNKEYKNINGPHLIVVPKSTLFNWKKEFNEWCPVFKIFLLNGDKNERKELLDQYINSVLDENNLEFNVCVTSYEQCNIEAVHLKKINWFYIVVDEAHRMKNENAKLSRTMRSFASKHRLLITGTPLQNNLHELWSLLNFLIPEAFKNADSFDVLFEAQQNHKSEEKEDEFTSETLKLINNMLSQMHNLLRPLMLRRLKYDVEKSLPPKTEMILYVGMTKLQITLYKTLLAKNIGVLKDTIKSKKALLNTAMQLRKVCNHPYLFENVEDRSLPAHGRHLTENAAKLCMLDKLLPRFKEQGSKCLIFCQMTRMLDILDDYCSICQYQRCRIDGNTAGHDRQSQMDDFNSPNSTKFIFLLSTRAGGLGINLVAADCVIFYDSDWNPQMDLQAQDRAHRIGQTKHVKIFRLVTKNTIEEKILQRAQLKLNLDELVIQRAAKNNNNNNNRKKNVSKEEVSSMVKYGIEEIIKLGGNDSNNLMKEQNEMSIDEILSKGAEASSKLNELMNKHAKNRFSIKSTDYSLLEDCALDGEVFRILAKIKKQNKFQDLSSNNNKNIGRRTTNNSSNGNLLNFNSLSNLDFEKTIRAINSNKRIRESQRDRDNNYNRINDIEQPEKPPKMEYFQFFNEELLAPLYEKQWLWYNANKCLEQYIIEEREPNWTEYGLNSYESSLKNRLILESFGDWNYKHMWAYVKCCCDYGRENIDMICKALPMKSKTEIIKYSKVFFENAKQNIEINKKINDIMDGEAQIERYIKYNKLLLKKITKCGEKYPAELMEFNAPYDNRAHGWRVEHDRFILQTATKIGYGDWPKMKQEALKSRRFKFDYFMKSRAGNDINKRMRQLRPSIEKEFGQHIRIFDRKTDQEEINKRKLKQLNRHKNHLIWLNQKCKEIDEQEDIIKIKKEPIQSNIGIKREFDEINIDNQLPNAKRQKISPTPQQELPTPPPILPQQGHDVTNIKITQISNNNPYTPITPYYNNNNAQNINNFQTNVM